MNIAVCFLSTLKNHFNLIKLKEQSKNSKKHNIDIYEYIDNDSEYEIKDKNVYFNYNYLLDKINYKREEIYYIHINLGKKIGLEFLPLLDMYINHKNEYDMYMFYEDDVSYFSIDNLFDIIDFNCDALFSDKRFLVKDDQWYWCTNEKYNLDAKILYHGLLNIYGLNNYAINGLLDYIHKGNYCHHEGLISSFILNNRYKVNYINNYINSYFNWYDDVMDNSQYDLIHPVKTIEKYNLILSNKQH